MYIFVIIKVRFHGVLPISFVILTTARVFSISSARGNLLWCVLSVLVNRVCRTGGHYWDHYPGQVIAAYLKIGQAVDFNNGCYIFKWHDNVIKWKHFRVTGPLWGESTGDRSIPLKRGQWRGALLFFFICAWTNGNKNTLWRKYLQ